MLQAAGHLYGIVVEAGVVAGLVAGLPGTRCVLHGVGLHTRHVSPALHSRKKICRVDTGVARFVDTGVDM